MANLLKMRWLQEDKRRMDEAEPCNIIGINERQNYAGRTCIGKGSRPVLLASLQVASDK